ncbi:MAG: hypothetical protein L6Q69_00990 [Zoogloea sp.]|nr:hypothetical protein [Zoogloea sp.]
MADRIVWWVLLGVALLIGFRQARASFGLHGFSTRVWLVALLPVCTVLGLWSWMHTGAAALSWVLGLALVLLGLRHVLEARRRSLLAGYIFPSSLARKVRATYPHLEDAQVRMVIESLRSFFLISQRAHGRMVAMPSQAVDVAWHEFILFTRGYQRFCSRCLGRFLHHTPAQNMASVGVARQGLQRAWFHACALEGINPKQPARLPRLFAIDALLAIPDGFRYQLNCVKDGSGAGDSFCASDLGCGSSDGCGGDGGGDGDGCGGDGGGGCGGGD